MNNDIERIIETLKNITDSYKIDYHDYLRFYVSHFEVCWFFEDEDYEDLWYFGISGDKYKSGNLDEILPFVLEEVEAYMILTRNELWKTVKHFDEKLNVKDYV